MFEEMCKWRIDTQVDIPRSDASKMEDQYSLSHDRTNINAEQRGETTVSRRRYQRLKDVFTILVVP